MIDSTPKDLPRTEIIHHLKARRQSLVAEIANLDETLAKMGAGPEEMTQHGPTYDLEERLNLVSLGFNTAPKLGERIGLNRKAVSVWLRWNCQQGRLVRTEKGKYALPANKR